MTEWFARQRCSRCDRCIGDDGCPVFFGNNTVREIYFCPGCAVRMFDLVQAWFSMSQVGT